MEGEGRKSAVGVSHAAMAIDSHRTLPSDSGAAAAKNAPCGPSEAVCRCWGRAAAGAASNTFSAASRASGGGGCC